MSIVKVETISNLDASSSIPVKNLISKKGVTGSRPTGLTTADVGVQYFDVTLATNGKPIWWNGAAWVDATGALV